ncbi:MAG: hypothetical protein NTX38_00370 [Methylobacter sp.]|jgi:hypothetical protein|nr:hypothetical protein [Methylobacter sp.]
MNKSELISKIAQVSFGMAVLVAIFTDPLIFILTAGVLLWMYLDEFLAKIE